ncbi:MAG TPA: hypothetical protein PLG43_11775 [Spirochaetia bacterium]|jgi:hypothetical protein|nr:hypothetical protein [Spirochaetia bacterium]
MSKALMREGANTEAAMKGGDRPLVAVVRSYSIAIPTRASELYKQAKALLEGGADPSGPGAKGQCPIEVLSGEDYEGMRQLLESYLRCLKEP